jgi:hypothetical protein
MLERLRGSVDGRFNRFIRETAARNAPQRLDDLVKAAIAGWEAEGFYAQGTDEPSFNVRVYDHMRRIKQNDAMRWALVSVTMETGYPTAAQLAGQADPLRLARPDIVVRFGGEHEMHIEAKRVDETRNLTRAYVRNGLRRFIDGLYAHSPNGTMIGYVISDDLDGVLAAINDRIVEEPDLGAADVLSADGIPLPTLRQLRSEHRDGECRVRHHHVLVT